MPELMVIFNARLLTSNRFVSFGSANRQAENLNPNPPGDSYHGMARNPYRGATPPDDQSSNAQERQQILQYRGQPRSSDAELLQMTNLDYVKYGKMNPTKAGLYLEVLKRHPEDNLTHPKAARDRVDNHLRILMYPEGTRNEINKRLENRTAVEVNRVWSILKNKSFNENSDLILATYNKPLNVIKSRVDAFLHA
jgi:hypothetical protein